MRRQKQTWHNARESTAVNFRRAKRKTRVKHAHIGVIENTEAAAGMGIFVKKY